MAEKTVTIPDSITVGELAEKLEVSTSELIGELIKNGVMATINEKIDFDTAEIIVDELELDLELVREMSVAPEIKEKADGREGSKTAESRPPVVAVMGHVDHGKTSLLDAIRGSKVAHDEAGGITQHISAYQVKHKDRLITFLDTPGHEAFSALRKHGAKLTDLAVIVVAADDGVKPQTKEAIKFAKTAGVKILVAINKIDKAGANTNRVLQELNDNGLQPESWGGDTVSVEVSAVEGKGISDLLDMIQLVADVEDLKAESEGRAEGLVIEAHTETGKGAVVTLLVEHGLLNRGNHISAGSAFGKVRTIVDQNGKVTKDAGPSTPVVVTGFKQLPNFGDTFIEHRNEKEARSAAKQSASTDSESEGLSVTSSDLISQINRLRNINELPVIIRADVKGSLTSVSESLVSLNNDELSVRVIGSGVGSISESDVVMATTSGAVIYGFNVGVPVPVKQLAIKEGVTIKIFTVIYDLIDDTKEILEAMLEPQIKEEDIGRLLVKGVFRTTKNEVICGGEMTKGKVVPGAFVRVLRDKEQVAETEVTGVKRQQQDVKEVSTPDMCGLQLATKTKLQIEEGDRLEFFTREEEKRKLW